MLGNCRVIIVFPCTLYYTDSDGVAADGSVSLSVTSVLTALTQADSHKDYTTKVCSLLSIHNINNITQTGIVGHTS